MSTIHRTTLLDEDQVEALIDVAGEGARPGGGLGHGPPSRLSRRDRALVEVLYGSGLRVAEACGLKVQDLDFGTPDMGGAARVLGKGKKPRTVLLTPPAVEALRAYLAWRREGQVFRNARDEPMTPRLARKIVARLAGAAGLPHTSPHTLRHSCASHMLRRGAYLFTVQDLLGHAHPHTTAVYLHRMSVERTAADDYRATHPRAGHPRAGLPGTAQPRAAP